jgi:hypothetical protein
MRFTEAGMVSCSASALTKDVEFEIVIKGPQKYQRVTKSCGGVGFEKNVTFFRHNLKACQWMRTTTITVIKG